MRVLGSPGIKNRKHPGLSADPALEQAAPRRLEVGQDEINVAKRSGERIDQSLPDLDRAAGARRVSCTTRNASFGA
jgi:hypothetical protein